MQMTTGKKNLIIGLGLSGRSAARFLLQNKEGVIGVDCNSLHLETHEDVQNLKKNGMHVQLDVEPIDFNQIERVILSPGISTTHPLVQKAHQGNIEVLGEIELGCQHLKNSILGITGTNGKTTVTLLVTHVLNSCGYQARALGNVGVPFTQEISHLRSDEIVVLELSSYQLETLRSKVLHGALLLNITPDHLDRYACMQDYAAAKFRIQNCLVENKSFIVENQLQASYPAFYNPFWETYGYTTDSATYSDLQSVYYKGCKAFDLPATLAGRKSHDLENLMGAFTLCATLGITGTEFLKAFLSFRKPPHRLEFVLEYQGVGYYDDSKGTNIDAVIRAVQSLKGPIILIAGGVDKMFPYTPWIEVFKGKVKLVLAIGEASKKIKEDIGSQIPVEIIQDLEQAVLRAAKMAEKGGCVLLSPGCASFDMFKDYVHRGHVFQQAVRSLVMGDKECQEKIQY